MQNSIYKIKYLLYLSWDWQAWCLTQSGGNIPPPERNTAWNKGRKCFHCLGAPNNLIRPWCNVVTFRTWALRYIDWQYLLSVTSVSLFPFLFSKPWFQNIHSSFLRYCSVLWPRARGQSGSPGKWYLGHAHFQNSS